MRMIHFQEKMKTAAQFRFLFRQLFVRDNWAIVCKGPAERHAAIKSAQ